MLSVALEPSRMHEFRRAVLKKPGSRSSHQIRWETGKPGERMIDRNGATEKMHYILFWLGNNTARSLLKKIEDDRKRSDFLSGSRVHQKRRVHTKLRGSGLAGTSLRLSSCPIESIPSILFPTDCLGYAR